MNGTRNPLFRRRIPESVRRALYTTAGPVITLLAAGGLIPGNRAPVWESIVRPNGSVAPPVNAPMREQMRHFEKQCVENALRNTVSIRAAARALGISHATLLRKMREHDLVVQN